MKRKKYLAIILTVITFIVVVMPLQVTAQINQGANIAYTPIVEYLSLGYGEVRKGRVEVINQGNYHMDFAVRILPFTSITDQPGVPRPMSEEEASRYPYDASDWFSFSADTFHLDPLSSKEFEYTITVPEYVEPRGYYAGIFFEDITERAEIEGIGLGATLIGGPIFLLKPPGFMNESIHTLEFKTEHKLYEFMPVNFIITVQNTGNVHVVPRGEITVTDMFGKEVATVNLNEEKYNVLPEKTSKFTTEWKSGDKWYHRFLSSDNKLLIGRFRAELVLLYRSENPGYDYDVLYTTFWIFPWKIFLVVFLIILAIVFIIWYRAWKEKGVRKYMD